MKYLVSFLILFSSLTVFGQVKIGDNPSQINQYSLLELESSDKVFVLSRMTTSEMNLVQPLNGALVYNTDEQCVFVFEGTIWKSLCGSNVLVTTSSVEPTTNSVGDIWVDNSTIRNIVSVWDGSNWISINENLQSGTGAPTSVSPQNPIAGDVYVDKSTGDIYTYSGGVWINNTATNNISATNGISKSTSNVIELGGTLIKATEITTTTSNTLAITGLETAIDTDENDIVVIDSNTGVLKRMEVANLLREEEIIVIASEGQTQFTAPYPFTNIKQIDVYRNGVRIKFTAVDSTTIELEAEAVCYQNDEIRIVQFY